MKHRYDPVKRALDVVGAIVLLVLTAPLMVGVAALVRLKLGSPVLFRQERPGRHGTVFTLAKFRTMREPRAGEPDDDAARMTPLGTRLRSLSLDELPSLVNVLRGDMSLVGPRPLLVRYLDRFTPEQARRHAVRPGITGLAQVSGRNAITWTEKFAHDVEYVDNRSLWLDARIIWRTVAAVVARKGIAEEGSATMSEFLGTRDA